MGVGAVAQVVHLPLLAKRRDLFEIAALCEIAPDVLGVIGDRYGVDRSRRFSVLDDMLAAGGLDAVMILSRGSHADAVLRVWEAGLTVFCEKPLAFTLAEVDALLAAEPDFGHPALLLAYMKQYDPAVQEAARHLAEVDDIRSIEATVLHPTGAAQLAFGKVVSSTNPVPANAAAEIEAEDRRLWTAAVGRDVGDDVWRAYRGALVSSLAHDLSILRSFDSAVHTVDFADIWRQSSAHAVRDAGRDRKSFGEHPPSIRATGALEAGGRYMLAWHYLPDYPAYRETVRVVHGRGAVELIFPSPYLMNAPTELVVTTSHGDAERRSVQRNITEAFEQQLEAFHAMIVHGRPPLSGLKDGRADILACQSILAAHAKRMRLELGGEVGALLAARSEGVRR